MPDAAVSSDTLHVREFERGTSLWCDAFRRLRKNRLAMFGLVVLLIVSTISLITPFIAPGDALYLQGAYGSGAQMYTGYCAFSGCYSQNPATIQGQKFAQYMNDATLNPFTGQLEQSTSFSATA